MAPSSHLAVDHGGAACTSCGAAIALWSARPRLHADGRVELQCIACASGQWRPVTVAPTEPPPEPPRAQRRRVWIGAGGLAIGLVAVVAITAIDQSTGEHPRAAAAAVVPMLPAPAPVVTPAPTPVPDLPTSQPPNLPTAAAKPLPPLPTRDDEPMDEWFPTLADWVHPVPGSPDIVPHQASRFFGAGRQHHDDHFGPHPECGGGHCGVDLEGTRGQPVIAVAWGTVVRIQPDDVGDGGRYVRIEHPDFVYTSYFHLDRIAPGLKVGDEVQQGQVVGALGASGIHVSMPHLHFALELPDEDVEDGSVTKFVDPVPYLLRAKVLGRHAVPELPKSAQPADKSDPSDSRTDDAE